jgi:hypothetical protein
MLKRLASSATSPGAALVAVRHQVAEVRADVLALLPVATLLGEGRLRQPMRSATATRRRDQGYPVRASRWSSSRVWSSSMPSTPRRASVTFRSSSG